MVVSFGYNYATDNQGVACLSYAPGFQAHACANFRRMRVTNLGVIIGMAHLTPATPMGGKR